MPRRRRRLASLEHHYHHRERKDTGRARIIAARSDIRRDSVARMLFGQEYRALARYLGFREMLEYVFLSRLMYSPLLPDEYRAMVEDSLRHLRALAIRRALEVVKRYMPIRYANHPTKVRIELPYSLTADLAALAQLSWMNRDPWMMPIMAGLAKHLWCNSSRTFMRWDGTRVGRFYLAINVVKLEEYSAAPNTGDEENATLPVMDTWIDKWTEDYTTILNAMAEDITDMAKARAALTRTRDNEPLHTVPVVLAVYTDYPQRIRTIVMGIPEFADVIYHCSLYYMPITANRPMTTRPHRIYEARVRRRYRRMEGWIAGRG